MCFACEEAQMLAAYRDYVARRKAALVQKRDASADEAGSAADAEDWAKGTWFAAGMADPND